MLSWLNAFLPAVIWRWAQAVNHWVGAILFAAARSANHEYDPAAVINRTFKSRNAYVMPDSRLKNAIVRGITGSDSRLLASFLP
ncbi:hypothetical protein BL250_17010 [Erwinia sp. OLTSP20]|nr:hypothetical protein BV501_15085 [Erwinia sp. OAMSP11]PIJ75022.1 hypothetical protein BK416_02705 [Erwinia sp. OLSSP12]PIJ79713.1 hypothetical protein BLD47_13710 [Erwinia sp. OLCASP19]PIJ80498.1 hypothetical protein BLD46_15555 [Erwinia sp. OLMTSP26]PIJ82613.1 hypothetical protein BLD49_15450 [Erwinia sp. OLMDSP33]PIJ88914.1 hypothetical protein BL250_17010 [Erwinia sp. OLTSP20]PIJ91410.1 hypothetical protein BL249_08655 [Erwinia sp. OLFS4]